MENTGFLQIDLFSRPQLLSLYNDVVLCTPSVYSCE